MIQKGNCALCDNSTNLQISHLVPRFVSKYLKKTSATGFMRDDMGKRIQDVPKQYLLCSNCEQQFSTYESYFAQKVFYPVIESDGNVIVVYDEKLLKFIISLNWKLLMSDFVHLKKPDEMHSNIFRVANVWKKYLLDLNVTVANNNYLFFWENAMHKTRLQMNFIGLTHRTCFVDHLRDLDGYVQMVICQIPQFTIISTITPKEIPEFEMQKIFMNGNFYPNAASYNLPFYLYLIRKAHQIGELKMPESEIEKITEKLIVDLDNTFLSESSKIFTYGQRDFLKKRKKESF